MQTLTLFVSSPGDVRDERQAVGRIVERLQARYWNFKTVTRSKTLELPVNLGKRIYGTARELLDKLPPGPLRLLGVQLSNLSDVRAPVQASAASYGSRSLSASSN